MSGLLRTAGAGLGMNSKPIEEAKVHWAIEGEKTLRENLAVFFVYLFASLDDCILEFSNNGDCSKSALKNIGTIAKGSKEMFGQGDRYSIQ